ncbi:DUF3631 domain-containing protein [Streptomyces sp. NPDC051364]|uniref:DUF3631 domain-containing protein n=1 Tax=Streptomyces sp. NPDC051364 TaxID=3155799 RepID=UPI00342EB438
MTTYPSFLDNFTTTLMGTKPKESNLHHWAILDAFTDVQDAEQRLRSALTAASQAGSAAAEKLDECLELLLDRLAAGADLSMLLSTACCSVAGAPVDKPCALSGLEQDEPCCQEPEEPAACLLDACSNAFAELGNPHAVASADLVDILQHLPGVAGNHWRYSDLTQARLAQLLAPHGMRTRDITLPDGRRRKSYSRETLLTAMGVCTSC